MNQFFRNTLIYFLLGFESTTLAINTEAEGFRVNAGQNADINVHSDCLNVSNGSSNDIFIPTATSTEWTTFQSNLPTNVTTSACGGGSPSLTFSGSTKTEADCTTDGGTVVSSVDGTLCQYNAGSCPAGWSNADNWSTTSVNTGTGSFPTFGCNYQGADCKGETPGLAIAYFGGGSETLTTGSHTWSNTAVETDQCNIPTACVEHRATECDSGAFFYDRKDSSSDTEVFCGGGSKPTKTDVVIITAGPEVEGAYAYVSVGVSQISATITQIGCR